MTRRLSRRKVPRPHPLALQFVPGIVTVIALLPSLFDWADQSTTAKILYMLGAFVLTTGAGIWQIYLPSRARNDRRKDAILNVLTSQLLQESKNYTGCECEVRVNVMLARRDLNRPWRRFLEMRYAPERKYTPDEWAMRYPMGHGICGMAFERNQVMVQDLSDPRVAQLVPMPPFAESLTKDVKSVMAVPIYSPDDEAKDDPIGILNLDSPEGLESSKLDDPKVTLLAIKVSAFVGVVLALS
ncbi:MAG TPA: hypothetical protein VFU72_16355 [Nitrolancea sp.]|nr:hypothetical protein [Nitrolancea sp.]